MSFCSWPDFEKTEKVLIIFVKVNKLSKTTLCQQSRFSYNDKELVGGSSMRCYINGEKIWHDSSLSLKELVGNFEYEIEHERKYFDVLMLEVRTLFELFEAFFTSIKMNFSIVMVNSIFWYGIRKFNLPKLKQNEFLCL